MALAAPWLAILAVIAALVTKVQLEVMREEPGAEENPETAAAEKPAAKVAKPRKKAV